MRKGYTKTSDYKYSGYLCRAMNIHNITAPSGRKYVVIVTVNRSGRTGTTHVKTPSDELIANTDSFNNAMRIIYNLEAEVSR